MLREEKVSNWVNRSISAFVHGPYLTQVWTVLIEASSNLRLRSRQSSLILLQILLNCRRWFLRRLLKNLAWIWYLYFTGWGRTWFLLPDSHIMIPMCSDSSDDLSRCMMFGFIINSTHHIFLCLSPSYITPSVHVTHAFTCWSDFFPTAIKVYYLLIIICKWRNHAS